MAADPSALLWAGVVAMGLYHGLNPAMGWPLAVANGLGERRAASLVATFAPLGAGHLLAMAGVLLPFTALAWWLEWSREIRGAAGLAVIVFGLSRLLVRGHPRWFSRIRPSQVMLWSFVMASAHGAALMLLPLVLGLCETPAPAGLLDHDALRAMMRQDLAVALGVAGVHTAAMLAAGLLMAWLVYRHLGLRALRATWLNLDLAWALSLVVSGAAAVAMAIAT